MTAPNRVFVILLLCVTLGGFVQAQPATAPDARPPNRITLHYENADPRTVFDDFAGQLGMTVVYPPGLWSHDQPAITIHADRERAAAVLVDLFMQAHVIPADESVPEGALALRPAPERLDENNQRIYNTPYTGPSAVAGESLLVVNQISAMRSVLIGQPGTDLRAVSLRFRLVFDPSSPPLQIASNVQIMAAVDENGTSLIWPGRSFESYMSVTRLQNELHGSLQLPANVGQRIAHLAGAIQVLEVLQSDTVEIPDILGAAGTTKTVAGIPFTVVEVTNEGNQARVKLTVDTSQIVPDARKELWNLFQQGRPQLLDGDGNAYQHGGADLDQQDQQMRVRLTYFAPPSGPAGNVAPPATLRWTVPVLAEKRTLPFEFKDLPLP